VIRTAEINAGDRSGVDGKLFTFSSLEQPVGYFFVNFPPVADGENPDHSGLAIQFVDDASPRFRPHADR